MQGVKVIAAAKKEVENQSPLCHTDGPSYNDSSGSDDFENWSNG